LKTCNDWDEALGQCYKIDTSVTATWSDARTACQAQGADLCSILNDGIQSLVASLSPTTDFWIGGNDIDDPTNFSWINGDAWSYTNWNKNQPNHNSNQDCVKVKKNTGLWDDVSCNNPMLYCCQKAPW